MGWVEGLHDKCVGLDSSPLMYFIKREQDLNRYNKVKPFFDAVEEGKIDVVASTVLLTETLSRPHRENRPDLIARYEQLLLGNDISLIAVQQGIARKAAELRAQHGLKTPDAIHFATALAFQADAFLTNVRDFPSLPDIEILRVDDL